ncbi:Zn-dependent exopeptidase [Trametopsis cervina]|nr:Zn-dependent exopeptidase [Trametopsis cervina]
MLVKDLSPLVLWVLQQSPASVLEQSPCLSFYGSSHSGKAHIFGTTDDSCVADASKHFAARDALRFESEHHNSSQLVWFERDTDAHDPSIASETHSNFGHVFDNILGFSENTAAYASQQAVQDHTRFVEVLEVHEHSALVRLERSMAQTVDTQLPRFWKSMILPEEPISYLPVPAPAVKRVQQLLDGLKFDPVIQSLVNSLSISQMKKDIEYLTGEDPKSPIVSRHSFSDGVRIAANWLKDRFEENGATCELKSFRVGFAPNVICKYAATAPTNETVLLSAHYDSRGSFGSFRAPGGDDDGSGTTAVLAIARAIGKKGITFTKNVELCTFAGEEQGLLGSRAYAEELRAAGADLTLMVQADMTAYRKAGEPPQLGLPATIGTTEVTQLVSNISAIYSPELTVGFTAACCSDHQSFHELGYPATQVFERAGPIADPMYHNSGDLSDREGYDFHQLKSIAKVQFATLLHAAGYKVSDDML